MTNTYKCEFAEKFKEVMGNKKYTKKEDYIEGLI